VIKGLRQTVAVPRVAIFGDIGGHAALLREALVRLGARPADLRLPPDLTVIQVGDLVHRGPDSPGVLDIVDRALAEQPAQWIQLIGNHEAQYLPNGSRFHWREPLPPDQADRLRAWWAAGTLRVAAAVHSEQHGDLLATHAGLTLPVWREIGRPAGAAQAAAALNALPRQQASALWRTGMRMGGQVCPEAGPLWAEAGWELRLPWMRRAAQGRDAAFGQVHGHCALLDDGFTRWDCPPEVAAITRYEPAVRHCWTPVGGHPFVAIDPRHGRAGVQTWGPLVLSGAAVTA
jgi:Calcineurin-like phosphoesterase